MQVLIDINQSGLELDSEVLEAYSLRLVDELRGMADGASLVRADQIPQGAMSADRKFNLGFLQAKITFVNLKKVLDWLSNMFSAPLELEYEEAGRTVKFKYKTNQDLDAQVAALERIADIQTIKIKVIAEGQLDQ